MSGIVFFGTTDRPRIVEFYTDRLGFDVWLEQSGCTILRHDNLLVGFCDREQAETAGVVTLVEDTRAAVDERHRALADVARDEPAENEAYRIYQFFADDPDGRTLEIQTFHHPTDPPIEG